MQVDKITPWLASARLSAAADLKPLYTEFEQLYDKKYWFLTRLWHQLTIAVGKFSILASAASHLIPLYTHFIKDWEAKMNTISLVQFVSVAAQQLKDPKEALAFISVHVQTFKADPKAQDAFALAIMHAAGYKLALGDITGCKEAIKTCEKVLESLPGTNPVINAIFYRVSADYYKTTLEYPQYYHNALLFLSSVSLEDLTVEVKQQRAHDLAMSALLGDGLYNFGELLTHPILESLVQSPFAWLRTLLLQYNSGDLAGFEKVSRSPEFIKQVLLPNKPLLVGSIAVLKQKLYLMTLVEIVFKRPKADRERLSFADIEKETSVAAAEVEHLVMKALSLGLIKGSIDESESVVVVTWVQPRILSKPQVATVRSRITEWVGKVDNRVAELELEEGFQTVFAQ